jgi:hypothetical protein
MVSKCANPACAASFRYFHDGQLFRLETPLATDQTDDNDMKRSVRRLEFYWLCDGCARRMTLAFEKGVGVSIRPQFSRSATAA